MSSKDYRLELRVKNNRFLTALDNAGYASGAEFSRASGIRYQYVTDITRLALPAYTKDGAMHPVVEEICDFLCCSVDDIYPPEVLYEAASRTVFISEVSAGEVASLGHDPDLASQIGDLEDVRDMLSTPLRERERLAINMRYGLDGEDESTFKEIGERLGVEKARAAQICNRAELRMRNYMYRRNLPQDIPNE